MTVNRVVCGAQCVVCVVHSVWCVVHSVWCVWCTVWRRRSNAVTPYICSTIVHTLSTRVYTPPMGYDNNVYALIRVCPL